MEQNETASVPEVVFELVNSSYQEPPYLFRVIGPLSEDVLLSIIHSARGLPGSKVRTIMMSPDSAAEFISGQPLDRRFYTHGFDEEGLRLSTPAVEGKPGVNAKIEVSFAFPKGFVSID
jgi:hypothetical protein